MPSSVLWAMNSISCTSPPSLYLRFKGRVPFRLTICGNQDSGNKEGGVGALIKRIARDQKRRVCTSGLEGSKDRGHSKACRRQPSRLLLPTDSRRHHQFAKVNLRLRPTTGDIGPQMEDEGGAYQAEAYPWRHEGDEHSGREARQDSE